MQSLSFSTEVLMHINKIIACAVFVGVLTLSAAAASADGTIGIYDYAPGGALTSDSGEKFAVNGGLTSAFIPMRT